MFFYLCSEHEDYESEEVKSGIHKLIFCANAAFGAIGGLRVLKDRFGLTPDAISGVCSSSPLHVRELSAFTDIPVFNSVNPGLDRMAKILLPDSPGKKNSKRKKRAA